MRNAKENKQGSQRRKETVAHRKAKTINCIAYMLYVLQKDKSKFFESTWHTTELRRKKEFCHNIFTLNALCNVHNEGKISTTKSPKSCKQPDVSFVGREKIAAKQEVTKTFFGSAWLNVPNERGGEN